MWAAAAIGCSASATPTRSRRVRSPTAPSSMASAPVRRRSRTRASTRSSRQLVSANTYAESDYHSFQAALNRRFSSNLQSQLSYTLSRCRDTTSGNSPFEGGTAAHEPVRRALRLRSLPDRPHAQPARERDLSAAVQGERVRLGLAGVGNHQRRQRRAVHAARWIRPGRPADRRHAAPEPGGRPLARRRGHRRTARHGVRLHREYFDPTFFTLPAAGTLGTGVGRDSLRAPDCSPWISASARTSACGRPVSAAPRRGVQSVQPGELRPPNAAIFIATADGGAAYNPKAGQITTARPPRQVQLAAKLVF